MALIAVAEDDPGTRKLLSVVLTHMGHEVVSAADGRAAWALVREHRPDLIVSDVNMPGMNGFDLLEAVRKDPALATTPFILLTSLQERRDMRQGMRLGADDYLSKPFQSRELREAVDAQINKHAIRLAAQDMLVQHAVDGALLEQASHLTDQYEGRLARALSEQWPTSQPCQEASRFDQATVLVADIRHYPEWLTALSADELGELLKRFYENSGDTVFLFSATAMQFVGEGVMAVFADRDDAPTAPHSLRAVRAAFGLRNAAASLRNFIEQRFAGRHLPRFDVGMALHSGPVAMMRLEGLLGGATQVVPVGETVTDAMAILRHAPSGEAPVTVSVSVLRSITGAVQPARRYLVQLPQRAEPIDVCRIEPLAA